MSSVHSTIIDAVPQGEAGALFLRLNADFGLPKTDPMVGETLDHLCRGECLLFTAGDKGFVLLNTKPFYASFARLGIPEIQDLAVHPDHRRQGLGAALVRACEDWARARDHALIGLGVGLHIGYGAAQRLYAQLGYLPDGNGLVYNGEPVPTGESRPNDDDLCLMMVKEL